MQVITPDTLVAAGYQMYTYSYIWWPGSARAYGRGVKDSVGFKYYLNIVEYAPSCQYEPPRWLAEARREDFTFRLDNVRDLKAAEDACEKFWRGVLDGTYEQLKVK